MQLILPYLGTVSVEGDAPDFRPGTRVSLGISARNRLFSIRVIRSYFLLARLYQLDAVVLIVDEPYAWNDAAAAGLSAPSPAHVAKVIQEGDQRHRSVLRAARGAGVEPPRVIRWPEITEVSRRLGIHQEFAEAARKSDSFQRLLEQQVGQFFTADDISASNYFGFQLQELPALVCLYYHLGYLIDFYPGKNFPFFRLLEAGDWRSLLPRSSSLAADRKLSFITFDPDSLNLDVNIVASTEDQIN
jgi:hypothetical protein